MKFFLDTANLDERRGGASWGIVDGDISAGVVSTEASAMIQEGRGLAQIHKNVRSPIHVEVPDMLFNHPLTDKGLEQFQKDWAKVFQWTSTTR